MSASERSSKRSLRPERNQQAVQRFALVLSTLIAAGCGRTASYSSLIPGANPDAPFCGDAEVQKPEECDDGNGDATDVCLPSCVKAKCGDGIVHTGVERCDDGNDEELDGCTKRCALPGCGDGRTDPGEACDDGNSVQEDDCLNSCLRAFCGDGVVKKNDEQCDDGNASNDDGCLTSCRVPVCGDGKKEGSEQCDLGKDNGDRPAFLISQPSGTRIATNPLFREQTAVGFYGYRSASSHTGLEKVGESRIYLFVDTGTGRLSLVLTHGIDKDPGGPDQPESRVTMDVTGLPAQTTVDVSDDPGEFTKPASTTGRGNWTFNQNSDGAVIGNFPFPGSWKVTVSAKFDLGINTWGWVKEDGNRIPLVLGEPITIEALDTGSFCRANCTVPVCGDGKLDAGEVCDDGNTKDADRCSADCLRTR